MINNEKDIAFFPLNVFLFPGEDIPLRIFEPRYKQLINDCKNDKASFGIPFVQNNEVKSYGSEVVIRQIIAKNSKGEMVISVEGQSNFKMNSFSDKNDLKLYPGGNISIDTNKYELEDIELFKILNYYSENFDSNFGKRFEGKNIYILDIAKAINLSSEDKYKYICYSNLASREKFLKGQLSYLIHLREQEKLLQNDYSKN